jgi:hypothetical protein
MPTTTNVEQSAVSLYVMNVISRAVYSQAAARASAETTATLSVQEADEAAAVEGTESGDLPRLLTPHLSADAFEKFQPTNLREEQALASALAASRVQCAESDGASAATAREDGSIGTEERQNLLGRVTCAFNHGKSYMEDKLSLIGNAWDNVDHTAEKYTQHVGGLVKEKASAISVQARSTYQSMDAVTQKSSAIKAQAQKFSRTANVVRSKTGDSLQAARGKVYAALKSGPLSGKSMSRGGA